MDFFVSTGILHNLNSCSKKIFWIALKTNEHFSLVSFTFLDLYYLSALKYVVQSFVKKCNCKYSSYYKLIFLIHYWS